MDPSERESEMSQSLKRLLQSGAQKVFNGDVSHRAHDRGGTGNSSLATPLHKSRRHTHPRQHFAESTWSVPGK